MINNKQIDWRNEGFGVFVSLHCRHGYMLCGNGVVICQSLAAISNTLISSSQYHQSPSEEPICHRTFHNDRIIANESSENDAVNFSPYRINLMRQSQIILQVMQNWIWRDFEQFLILIDPRNLSVWCKDPYNPSITQLTGGWVISWHWLHMQFKSVP